MLFTLDREGVVTLAEGEALAALGLKSGQAVGQSISEAYRDNPLLTANIRRALAGETLSEIIEVGGHTFAAHFYPSHSPDGTVIGVTGIAFDTTAYRHSEERYRQLFESITDICFVLDKEWRYTHANQATARVTTWEEHQLIGQRLQDVLPGIENTFPFQVYQKAAQTNQPYRFTSPTLTLPGSLAGTFDVMVYPVPEGILCIAQDITERAAAEQALRESEAKYHALFEESRDAFFMITLHGKITDYNHAMLDLFGYNRQELQQLHPQDLYVNDAERLRYMEEMELLGSVRDYPIRMRKKDGAVMDCLITANLWRDAGERLKGYQGIIRDITWQKRSEAQLQQSLTLLDALNRMQSEFIVEADPGPPFQRLLDTIMELTESSKGLIGEVVRPTPKKAFLKIRAQSNVRWIELLRQSRKTSPFGEVELQGQTNFLTTIAQTGKPIISDDPATDPRWGPIIPEHSPSRSFLGLPFFSGETLVGILGLSERPGGYDESFIAHLQPLLATCAGILERYRSELQRQEAEKALRDSEERYRLLVSSAPVPLFVHAKGKILYANEACARLLGAESADDLLDQAIRLFAHPDYQKAFEGHTRGKAGSTPALVQKITRLDGKSVDAEVAAIPITYHGASATQVMIHDVTERIRAERAEREQRVLAEALRDTAAVVNSTLNLARVLDLILANVGQVVPHDASSIMLVDEGVARLVGHQGYSDRGLDRAIETVRFEVAETPNLRAMSESHSSLIIPDVREYPGWVTMDVSDWVRSCVGAPIMLGGEAIGFINLDSNQPGFFTAFHAERLQTFASQAAIAIQNARLYEAARHHTAQLQSSNNELEAYSHTVAHDLKAPLHIVIGYSSLLLSDYDDQLTPEILAHVDQIEIYARKMNDMIESLLLLARLRDAQTTISPVAVLPVVRSAQDRFRQRIDERGVEVTLEPDLPDVMGYGPWLEEVFANLIENAIKYIGPNNPSPRIAIRGKALGDNWVRYEVEDNGLGIAKEHQESLFEMFTRFHADYTKGAGLGLSIVNRIIRKLGGEVGVVSDANAGSTFWFTLPAPHD